MANTTRAIQGTVKKGVYMCVRKCLCNSCHKRSKCTDCPYNKLIEKCDCYTDGITDCQFYIDPPCVN
jgi:hypothetical protein